MKAQKLNRRQARWPLYLFKFSFMLKHISESKMEKADSLSRRLDQEVDVEKDNENEMVVKLEWLEARRTKAVEIIVDRVDLLEKVRKSKVKDDKVVKAVEKMKQAGMKMLRDEEWREVNGVITPQMNFLQKITFDTLYTNKFLIRVCSRALSIPSERNTI